jgi:hypothetical protein
MWTSARNAEEVWSSQDGGQKIRTAQEATVSLSRLVAFWDDDSRSFCENEKLWGVLLRRHALDLGLADAWAKLPKDQKGCSASELSGVLGSLERRGVDLAFAQICIVGKTLDVQFCMPKAFPELGIMGTPDPDKVGLLA